MIQPHSLHVLINFLGFWLLFAFCGLLISRVWLVPTEAFALPEFDSRWRRMLAECLALMVFSGVMLLLVRTGEMAVVVALMWLAHGIGSWPFPVFAAMPVAKRRQRSARRARCFVCWRLTLRWCCWRPSWPRSWYRTRSADPCGWPSFAAATRTPRGSRCPI